MKILDEISNTTILVIGDVMLDRYWWGSVSRISPEAPVPIVRMEKTSLVAGGAANVAANLAGLGAHPVLFGVKGDDPEGDAMSRILIESGIKSHVICSIPGRKTSIKTRIVAHSQHVVRIDSESTSDIPDAQLEEVLENYGKALPHCQAVIISDYAKGFLTGTLLSKLIAGARAMNIPVVVDPKGKDFSKYRGAAILTPNKKEVAEATSMEIGVDEVVQRAGEQLIKSLDLQAILVTEGEDGMTLIEKEQGSTHLDSIAHNVYDVTGAGDTVIATFAAAVATGSSLGSSAKLANAAAGLVVEKIGTTSITRQMLEEFLADSEDFS